MVPVRIENRAQLIYLLTEACELEHSILCCYLFASYSMKEDTREGITAEQLEAVTRWRSLLREIVVEEMVHLASACNLLTAIGGAPQLRRPNLPSSPRAYPPRFALRLLPFTIEAVEQFVSLEQPESMWEAERAAARGEDYREIAVSLDRLSDIFSSERHYDTVGELYRGVEDGFAYLAQKLGERELFVGPPAAQTAETFFSLPGLLAVHDLASARAAINVIVEQGEGASIDVEDSHYKKFVRIRDQYREHLAADPHFEPARPVVSNPSTAAAADDDGEVMRIDDPLSVDVCNLFDGCYEVMVGILGRLFTHGDESEAQLATLADNAVGLMIEVLTPLGSALTTLPAGPAHPGLRAGPSFRLTRGATVPPHSGAAAAVFRERLLELASYSRFLQTRPGAPAATGQAREALTRYAAALLPA